MWAGTWVWLLALGCVPTLARTLSLIRAVLGIKWSFQQLRLQGPDPAASLGLPREPWKSQGPFDQGPGHSRGDTSMWLGVALLVRSAASTIPRDQPALWDGVGLVLFSLAASHPGFVQGGRNLAFDEGRGPLSRVA